MHGVPGRNSHTAATVGGNSHTAASRNSHAAAIAETAKLQRGLAEAATGAWPKQLHFKSNLEPPDGFRPQQPPFFNQNFHSGSVYLASLVLQKDVFFANHFGQNKRRTCLKPLFLHTLGNPHPRDAASHLTKTPHDQMGLINCNRTALAPLGP